MTGWLMIEGLQGPGCVAVSHTAIPSTSQGTVQNGRGRQRLNLGWIFSPDVVNEDNEVENKKPVMKNELENSTKTNAGSFENKIPQPVEYALGI